MRLIDRTTSPTEPLRWEGSGGQRWRLWEINTGGVMYSDASVDHVSDFHTKSQVDSVSQSVGSS